MVAMKIILSAISNIQWQTAAILNITMLPDLGEKSCDVGENWQIEEDRKQDKLQSYIWLKAHDSTAQNTRLLAQNATCMM